MGLVERGEQRSQVGRFVDLDPITPPAWQRDFLVEPLLIAGKYPDPVPVELTSALAEFQDAIDVVTKRLAPVVTESVGVDELAHRLEQGVEARLDPADLVGVERDAQVDRQDRRLL